MRKFKKILVVALVAMLAFTCVGEDGQKKEAQAIPAAVPVALEAMEAIAAWISEAGLTVTVGDIAAFSGIGIAAGAGVNIFEDNVTPEGAHNIIPTIIGTANLPAWEDLTETQQTSWVSEDNYNAFKLECVLDAFGLGDCTQSLNSYIAQNGTADGFDFTQYGSSSGGKFDYPRFANALRNTMQDGYIAYSDMMALITDVDKIFDPSGLGILYKTETTFHNKQIIWGIYDVDYQQLHNDNYYRYNDRTGVTTANAYNYTFNVNGQRVNSSTVNVETPRIYIEYLNNNIVLSNVSQKQAVFRIYKDGTMSHGTQSDSSSSANVTGGRFVKYEAYDGEVIQVLNILYAGGYVINEQVIDGNIPDDIPRTVDYRQINNTPTYIENNVYNNYGGNSYDNDTITNIYNDSFPNYDGDNHTIIIQYPDDGIEPDTPWTDIVRDVPNNELPGYDDPFPPIPDDPRPPAVEPTPDDGWRYTDWNPNDGWKDPVGEGIGQALNLQLDRLFPFCLVSDIGLLFEKLQDLGMSGGAGEYNTITVPVLWNSGDSADMQVDLTWLHDLLFMIRPFNLIALVALLFAVTLAFWKSIMTG